MHTLHFSIAINAPVKKVWDTMLGDTTYRQWSAAFMPGSYYEGSWETGSKILFLAPNDAGVTEGMVSRIKENRLHEFVAIEHLGFVRDGVEDTTSERIKEWAGAIENYTFTERDGVTTVEVDIDVVDTQKEEFEQMWPKALQQLKALAEK